MSIAPAVEARDRVFAVLQGIAPLTDLVGARIYPSRPAPGSLKPFVRVGVPDVVPDVSSHWRTGVVSMLVHLFVDQSEDVPDPETVCSYMMGEIAEALDQNPRIMVQRTQVLIDRDEPEQFHGICAIEVTPPAVV